MTKKEKNAILFSKKNLLYGRHIYAVQSNREFASKRFVIK